MTIDFRPATGIPPSLDAFRMEVGRLGFDRTGDVYASFKKKFPEFELDTATALDWADELTNIDHVADAISVLTLTDQIHPHSGTAAMKLGDLYASRGQIALAERCYQQALDENPVALNGPAKRKLAALRVLGRAAEP